MRFPWLFPALILLLIASGSPVASAHDQRDNQLLITKKASHCLSLTFLLRPIDSLHTFLAPTQDWTSFFNHFSSLEESNFKKQVEIIQSTLIKSTLILDSNNLPLPLIVFSAPDPKEWKYKVKEERILLLARANNFGHSLPVEFRAEACSQSPIDRVQITADPRLFPLEIVAHETDRFWLKEDVISATADF